MVILNKMLRMSVSIHDLQSFFTLFIAENPRSTFAVASGKILKYMYYFYKHQNVVKLLFKVSKHSLPEL